MQNFSRNTIKKFKSLYPEDFRIGANRKLKLQEIAKVVADRIDMAKWEKLLATVEQTTLSRV